MPFVRRPSHSRPALSGLVALVLVSVLAVLGRPAAAQSAASPAFPQPVLAPVLPPDDVDDALAVTSVAATTEPPGLEVRFREPLDLPDAFQYRVGVRFGEPGETGSSQTRVSFVAEEGGDPVGVVEVGEGTRWSAEGEVDVAVDDGVLWLGLPGELVVEEGSSAWLDLSLVPAEGDAAQRFVSPLVPAGQLLRRDGPTLAAARWAWGSVDQQPPATPLDLGPGPELRLEGDELVVEYQASVPDAASGRTLVEVVDLVRLAPDFGAEGAAPYLIAIDHDAGRISLLDGTVAGAWPAEVDADGDWIVTGLPPRPVGRADELRFALPAVLEAFGIDADDPVASDDVAVGIARSAQVRTSRATTAPVRSDGVLATTAWLTAGGAPGPLGSADDEPGADDDGEVAGAAGDESEPAAADQDDGNDLTAVIVIACVLALVGTAAFLGIRWWEHRRRVLASGPVVSPPRPAEPSETEREELAEFTRQLFDNRR